MSICACVHTRRGGGGGRASDYPHVHTAPSNSSFLGLPIELGKERDVGVRFTGLHCSGS